MDNVPSQLGAFEGYPGRQVFSHNIHLLKTAQYKVEGQFMTWSVANGAPGIACLSTLTMLFWDSVSQSRKKQSRTLRILILKMWYWRLVDILRFVPFVVMLT